MRKITRQKQISAITLSAILLASTAFLVLNGDIEPAYGAVNVKKDSFTKTIAAPPATQSVNVGFAMSPGTSVLFLWTTKHTNENIANKGFFSFGFSDGTNEGSIAVASDYNVDFSNTNRRASSTQILQILNNGNTGSGNTCCEATVTFTSTGFDLTWNPNSGGLGTEYLIHYLAISGLTNVEVGKFQAQTTMGIQTIPLATSFTPDVAMFIGIGNANSADPANAVTNSHYFMGAAKSITKRWAVSGTAEDNRDFTDTWKWQRTDSCILELTPSTGAVDARADLDSFNLGNIKINWADPPSLGDYIYYLAIKGGRWAVDSFTATTNINVPVDQSVTGVGFQPLGLLAVTQSEDTVNQASATNFSSLAIGATDGAKDGVAAFRDEDFQNFADVINNFNTTRIVKHLDPNFSQTRSVADHKSFDAGGFTWTWTQNIGIPYYEHYIAFADI